MTLSRSVVEGLEAVLKEGASGDERMDSPSEPISTAQAEKLLDELAPGFRIP